MYIILKRNIYNMFKDMYIMYIYSIHAMLAPQVETQVVRFFSQISCRRIDVENMRSCFRILAPDNRKCSQGLNGQGRVAPKPEEVPC